MIKSIKLFFEQLISIETDSPQQQQHALNLAVAAIMLEMSCIDNQIAAEEIQQLQQLLERQLDLPAEEIVQLKYLAQKELNSSTDYYQFTALINAHFGREQKREIIENLWRVAIADGRIDSHEEHYLRKIASLLHLPHSEYIKAKLRVTNN